MNGKDIAVSREPVGLPVPVIEDLDLNRAKEWLACRRLGGRPQKNSGIAAGFQMPPFQFQNKILVFIECPQGADGFPGAADHAIGCSPGGVVPIYVDPSIEIDAIEKIFPLCGWLRCLSDTGLGQAGG